MVREEGRLRRDAQAVLSLTADTRFTIRIPVAITILILILLLLLLLTRSLTRVPHVRIEASAPAAKFGVEDGGPACDAELQEESAGAALGDGVGNGAEGAAGCVVVDAGVGWVGCGEGVWDVLEGVSF